MRDRRQVILGGTAGVLLLLAVIVFIVRGAGRDQTAIGRPITIHGLCLACKDESDSTHGPRDIAPFHCDKCGADAVYPVQYCFNCNKRFIPKLVQREPDGPLRLPLMFRCPGCGSPSVMQYVPDLCQGTENLPWPSWP